MKTFLEGQGFQVKWVENGEEAKKYLESSADQVSLIISDIEMPVLDGFGLKEWLNKSEFAQSQ